MYFPSEQPIGKANRLSHTCHPAGGRHAAEVLSPGKDPRFRAFCVRAPQRSLMARRAGCSLWTLDSGLHACGLQSPRAAPPGRACAGRTGRQRCPEADFPRISARQGRCNPPLWFFQAQSASSRPTHPGEMLCPAPTLLLSARSSTDPLALLRSAPELLTGCLRWTLELRFKSCSTLTTW